MHCTKPCAAAANPAGYVVIRYHSNAKELKRQRMYEKALDVCATSPFARFVQRWVLAGVGHGARLAAIVGLRVRGTICGHVFLSYPLTVRGMAAAWKDLDRLLCTAEWSGILRLP